MAKNKLMTPAEMREFLKLTPVVPKEDPKSVSQSTPQNKPPTNPNAPKYYLPTDTAQFLFSIAGVKVENSALSIEKYIRDPGVDKNGNKEKMKITLPRQFSDKEKLLLRALNKAQNDALGFGGYQVIGTLGDRMAIGLGKASIFETGIILHKPYGFPYIPGSSIKGALRSFLVKEHDGRFDLDTLFGTQTKKGSLRFFDAYPTDKKPFIDVDIMNPHFGGWYMNGTPPTDTENPVPVKFYAVPKGAEFTFRISGVVDEPLKGAFTEMLQFAGLGAKTAVGYGWFQKIV